MLENPHASMLLRPFCPVQLINTAIRSVVPFDPDASDLPVAWCPALPATTPRQAPACLPKHSETAQHQTSAGLCMQKDT